MTRSSPRRPSAHPRGALHQGFIRASVQGLAQWKLIGDGNFGAADSSSSWESRPRRLSSHTAKKPLEVLVQYPIPAQHSGGGMRNPE